MGKYEVRVKEIEAVQFDGTNWVELTNFCGVREENGFVLPLFRPLNSIFFPPEETAQLYSESRGCDVAVALGDWIFKAKEGFDCAKDKAFRSIAIIPEQEKPSAD